MDGRIHGLSPTTYLLYRPPPRKSSPWNVPIRLSLFLHLLSLLGGGKNIGMKRTTSLIVAALAVSLAGCIDRKMTITSEPAGAVVVVSDVEIGRTPVTIPFTWYGDYEIILRQSGYKTIRAHANIFPPVYEIPPFDLLSELAPWTYHDSRYLHYRMQEQTQPSDQDLINRGLQMQKQVSETVKP